MNKCGLLFFHWKSHLWVGYESLPVFLIILITELKHALVTLLETCLEHWEAFCEKELHGCGSFKIWMGSVNVRYLSMHSLSRHKASTFYFSRNQAILISVFLQLPNIYGLLILWSRRGPSGWRIGHGSFFQECPNPTSFSDIHQASYLLTDQI